MSSPESTAVYVVADRFADFAAVAGGRTLTSLVRALEAGRYDRVGELVVHVGQGLGDPEVRALRHVLARWGRADVRLVVEPDRPAPRELVRRESDENVVVTEPVVEESGLHTTRLRLHRDNEFLLDHRPGPHLRSAVAVEAARQAFVAVARRRYLEPRGRGAHDLVIEELRTTFRDFLFPTSAVIRVLVTRCDDTGAGEVSFGATVEVVQAGRPVAVAEVRATAFPAGPLAAHEARRAARAVAVDLRDGDLAVSGAP